MLRSKIVNSGLLIAACTTMLLACQPKAQTGIDNKGDMDSVTLPKDTTGKAHANNIELKTKLTKTEQGINVEILQNGRSLQSINYPYDTEFEPNPKSRRDSVVLRDVTFDGHDDLLIYLGSFGNQGVEYFDCYVWDDNSSEFVHAPTFKDIQNPKVASTCIYSKARESAASYIYERWTYAKGRFTATARLVQRYTVDGTCSYDEYSTANDQKQTNLSRQQISSFWSDIVDE